MRRFINNIKNILAWIPILWNNYDWDYWCLLKIMHFKMLRMADSFEKYGMSEGSESTAKEMRQVAEAIKRVMDDEYSDEAFDEYHKRWGMPSLEKLNIPISDEERADLKRIGDEYTAKLLADLGYIFNTMRDKILDWWD
jgi:hypothetical protein